MLLNAHAEELVDAVDVFIESIVAFTVQQGARVLDTAQALGLPFKAHAHVEQLSDLGAAVMASDRGALSVDHIE
jgi:imidazolonepropionase